MIDKLQEGRASYAKRAWGDAFRSLSLADQASPLGGDDLERLANSAYLIGSDDDFLKALERAHHVYRHAGENARASRCAFWLGLQLSLQGESGRATGWLARAHRLLEKTGRDCVEHGYLLLPVAEQQLAAGDCRAAYVTATDAAQIGDQFTETDLIACARHLQGRTLIGQGQVEQGLALLDEVMVAVTAGELSPLITGLLYCSVIDACQQVYALDRSGQWTSALEQWCAGQPEMVAFTGTCRVHRAEILQLHGAWEDALEEARHACERFAQGIDQHPPAAAFYQQAEVHRLRGEFAAAEDAYRSASRWGCEPHPGLALLRFAQGRTDTAAAAIRRVADDTTHPLRRTRVLPAYIEIMLAAGDVGEAQLALRDLEAVAATFRTPVLCAMAAHARGAVELAEGNPQAAHRSLRAAWQAWEQIEAPYSAARARVLTALACRALGDDEGTALELDAARAVFERLEARPDVARIESLTDPTQPERSDGLTVRELHVLRLVATGMTNKAIATKLFLSEKTVDRHVSNLFTKLDVTSRTAATAYAYEHKLI